MSEFHKFVRETQAEYSKPDVEDSDAQGGGANGTENLIKA